MLQLEKPSIPVGFRPALQKLRPHLEPFKPVIVARVRIDGHAMQVELRLVPSAHDIQPGPARPCVTWSMVAIAFAPNAGVTRGTCTVEKMAIRCVSAPRAAPWVSVSNDRP